METDSLLWGASVEMVLGLYLGIRYSALGEERKENPSLDFALNRRIRNWSLAISTAPVALGYLSRDVSTGEALLQYGMLSLGIGALIHGTGYIAQRFRRRTLSTQEEEVFGRKLSGLYRKLCTRGFENRHSREAWEDCRIYIEEMAKKYKSPSLVQAMSACIDDRIQAVRSGIVHREM